MLNEKHIAFLAKEMGIINENVSNLANHDKATLSSICIEIIADEYHNELDNTNYNPEREAIAEEIFDILSLRVGKR
jgi:hypothetical protein